jgi:hypothetical protein
LIKVNEATTLSVKHIIPMGKDAVASSASTHNFMGTGTQLCARNAGVDFSRPHVATKWLTIFYLRFWPLGTFLVQNLGTTGVGVPLVGGLLSTRIQVLKELAWTANKGHIIRSLVFSWGFVALVLYGVMASK